MNRRASLPIFAALVGLLSIASGKKEKFAVTFHLEVDHRPQGKNTVFEDRVGDPPRETLFAIVPFLSHKDVAAFQPFPTDDGSFGAVFQLDHGGKRRLMTISASKQGAFIRILVNGRPADYLLIDRQIEDGKIVVWRGIPKEVIGHLKKKYPLLKKR